MSMEQTKSNRPKLFLNIPDAAKMSGYSSRHFRRIIEENRIPVLQIGRKFFILSRDLEAWKSSQSQAHMTVTY